MASSSHSYVVEIACDEEGSLAVWVDGDELCNDLQAGTPVAVHAVNVKFTFPSRSPPQEVEATAPAAR